MLGTCGEYIVGSTNVTDNIIDKIKQYELSLNLNTTLPSPFIIKKIGIRVDTDCAIELNGRVFNIKGNEALEFGYDYFDITSIICQTEGVELTIRYLY